MGRERYLVLEGGFKCGKTTQADLCEKWLKAHCVQSKVVKTREPGGSEIADYIRSVVQGEIAQSFSEQMTPECNAALYMASRGQTLPAVVKPVLDEGGIVLSDRCFMSSVAFQGAGQRFGVEKVLALNTLLVGDMIPGLALYIDVPAEVAYARLLDVEGDKWERMGEDFFERVRGGYKWMVKNRPELNLVEVDGVGTVDEVQERILERMADKLKVWGVAMLGL